MHITLTTESLRSAPPEVKAWLASQLGLQASPTTEPSPEPKAEPTPEPAPEPASKPVVDSSEKDRPTIEHLIQRATELVDAKGSPETLLSILSKLGIPRVTECPPDRIAEVLAEIAVHE